MKLTNTLLALAIILTTFGCNEEFSSTSTTNADKTSLTAGESGSESDVTVTAISTSTASQLSDYTVSSFSNYIYFGISNGKILILLDFFPVGYDLCQQATYNASSNPNGCLLAKTVVIPCEFQSFEDNDFLSISVSEGSTTTACENKVVVDFSAAEFTVDGLVLSFSDSLGTFENDFEFSIKSDGFYDKLDGTLLVFNSTDVGLSEIYDKIVTKRTE